MNPLVAPIARKSIKNRKEDGIFPWLSVTSPEVTSYAILISRGVWGVRI